MSNLLDGLEARLASEIKTRNAFVDGLSADDFTEVVGAHVTAWDKEIDALSDRVAEVRSTEQRAAEADRLTPLVSPGYVGASHVYRKESGGASFFRDLVTSQKGDWEAAERLNRNNATVVGERKKEFESIRSVASAPAVFGSKTGEIRSAEQVRSLSTTAGAGGQFAPPLWLVQDYVELARAARPFADGMHKQPLPDGVSSINLPSVATGTTVGVQATQNSGLSNTDITTSAVSSGICTIGGFEVISEQLLRQSPIPFDEIIFTDLTRAYATAVDAQALQGTGTSGQVTGILNLAGVHAQTYTQASPTVAGSGQFLSQIAQAVVAITTSRFMRPTAIYMHPRRWAWVAAAVDNQNRPLIVPDGVGSAVNAFGTGDAASAAQGAVGQLQGLPVFLDASIPTNQGAGTNQDAVLIGLMDDAWLYEADVAAQSFDATYANQASLLLRVLGYAALVTRYPTSFAAIEGTGLITPTY